MSWDFNAVCDRCKKFIHLGQTMGGSDSFGYGSGDKEGRRLAAGFIVRHLYEMSCPPLRIMSTDDLPEDYRDVGHDPVPEGDGP